MTQILERKYLILGGIIGFAFFYLFYGLNIFHPHNISWVLASPDGVQHFIGWEYFRYEPWHFPLGKIQNFGLPLGTSIVYTDSIPLVAIPLKLFSSILPVNFQYFGMWVALCYLLQGLFAWWLSYYISQNIFIRFCITLFFILNPMMMARVNMMHHSLVSQWVLLAGLLLYLQKPSLRINIAWLILLIITTLIHAYLLLMLVGIWLAFFAKALFIENSIYFKNFLFYFVITCVMLITVMWVSGYFVVSLSHDIQAGGYVYNSMNLDAPIDPNGWSRFLQQRTLAYPPQQYEGFNYFGLGLIFMFIISGYEIIKNPPKKNTVIYWLPLLILSIVLTLFALSNQITLGSHVILTYPLPAIFSKITETFRSSGRFFWPVYYITALLIMWLIVKRNKVMTASFLLALALFLQLSDFSIKYSQLHKSYKYFTPFDANFTSSFWQIAATKYNKILFVPVIENPQDHISNFTLYLYYAASHHMAINSSYVARENNLQTQQYAEQLLKQVSQGKFDQQALYIILDPKIFAVLQPLLKPEDKIETIDSYTVIAPNWYPSFKQSPV